MNKLLYKIELHLVKVIPMIYAFDNYVREGKLPRGKHEAGFKELSWDKKTLDEFIRRNKIRKEKV